MSDGDVDAIVDFIENALYDPAFVHHDPTSTTRTFDPDLDDLTYSKELKALGAKDGLLPSLMAVGNNDPLSRRQTIYTRGNANGDGRVDISDAMLILAFLFTGTEQPEPMVAADANHDDHVDIADPAHIINFLFYGGLPPEMPFPEPGQLMP